MEKYKSVVCAIVKNEQRFIREWVEHNLNIGFNKIYVYEDFGSVSHKNEIADYIDGGKVELTNLEQSHVIPHYKRGTLVQFKLYEYFFNKCKDNGLADWVAFIDIDEFIMFEDGWNLEKLEDEFSDCGGVLLAWKIYGANGHLKRPEGNVVDNYTTHMPLGCVIDGDNQWNIKSLVNVSKCDGIIHVHVAKGCQLSDHSELSTKLVFDKAWINHYFTKSWEDYLDRIFARGNMHNNYRCLDKFFKFNPDLMDKKESMVMEQRYRHATSTMWISREMKIISGGNEKRLEELRKKYIQNKK